MNTGPKHAKTYLQLPVTTLGCSMLGSIYYQKFTQKHTWHTYVPPVVMGITTNTCCSQCLNGVRQNLTYPALPGAGELSLVRYLNYTVQHPLASTGLYDF